MRDEPEVGEGWGEWVRLDEGGLWERGRGGGVVVVVVQLLALLLELLGLLLELLGLLLMGGWRRVGPGWRWRVVVRGWLVLLRLLL